MGWARLTAFDLGQIKAHASHGLAASHIVPLIKKSDGTHPSVQGVVDALARMGSDPAWRGQRAEGSGRKKCISKQLDQESFKVVVAQRSE